MRDKPEYLRNSTESLIAFNAMDFGIMNARFESACLTHGDGDSFSWLAGGGAHHYSIRRIDRGFVKDDGTSCSAWEFVISDQSDTAEVFYINIPELEIKDILGQAARPKVLNDICDGLIDLSAELLELDRHVPNIIVVGPSGQEDLIPSYRFYEDQQVARHSAANEVIRRSSSAILEEIDDDTDQDNQTD